jgi:exodeoxyribonuclease-5
MILTAKQEEGLKIAVERYNNHEPYTVIAGYAGVGKSTLIRFISAALDLDPHFVTYIAYTGKAAQVLRNKGCPNAMTAHRLLYKSHPRDDGTFIHIPVESLAPYKLIVVDEVSMLPKKMWEQLLYYHVHVIALGDPGQLPPVAAENNEVLDHPHIFLDEVMRQAAESEIIQLTMDIRDGKPLKYQLGNEVRIVDRTELLKPGFLFWGDQTICGKNDTRRYLNQQMREGIWKDQYSVEPIVGDKLICLKNDWDRYSASGDAMVNGLTGHLKYIRYAEDPAEVNPFMEKTPIIDFQPDFDGAAPFLGVETDYKIFTEGTTTVTRGYNSNWKKIPKQYHPHEFDYGYAITCHKSQGSEFDKVIVLEEFLKSESREDHIRWLYTAATRAAQKLIIVKNFHI